MKRGKGRPKGALNKVTVEAQELAQRLGCNPFEILLHFANGDWKSLGYKDEFRYVRVKGEVYEEPQITPEARLTAAKEAVQYLLPKRKAIEMTNPDGATGFRVVIEDYKAK